MRPAISELSAIGSTSLWVVRASRPKSVPQRPKLDRMKPGQSKRFTSGSRTSSMKIDTRMMPRMPIGTFIQKIQRQEATVMMKPATTGPMMGPMRAGMPMSAMAEMSSDFGTERTRIRRPTGTIMAPPMPCTTRASSNHSKVGASPQPMEARVKMMMASRKMVRAPNLSATQPDTGRKAASDSMKEVMMRCSRRGVSPSDRAMAGSAVANAVESRFCMNRAQATISGTMTRRGTAKGGAPPERQRG